MVPKVDGIAISGILASYALYSFKKLCSCCLWNNFQIKMNETFFASELYDLQKEMYSKIKLKQYLGLPKKFIHSACKIKYPKNRVK